MKDRDLRNLAVIIILFGIAVAMIFTFAGQFFNWSFQVDENKAYNYGGFIGGVIGTIFALANAILLFVTIREQSKFNKIAQVENGFYKMIEFHKQNVEKMNLVSRNSNYSGERVFIIMRKQLKEILKKVKEASDDLSLNLENKDIINISYYILFYGLNENRDLVYEKLKSRYKDVNIESLIKKLEKYKIYIEENIEYLNSNESNLGHYFRNLYGAVKFIDEDQFLDENQKYQFVKILRSQLSNSELSIIFFNCLSDLGKPWISNDYIDNYQFIKNLPRNYCFGYEPKVYFPNITFEYEEHLIDKSSNKEVKK